MRKFLMILIWCCILPVNPLPGSNIVIRDINEEYNLPRNRVNCMVQDAKGFLWFGMVNGLYKFDLISFTKFELSDHIFSGVGEKDVLSIIEYEPGSLLVGTNRGLYLFNSTTERHDTIKCYPAISFSGLQISCLHEQQDGTIWIGTNEGMVLVRAMNGKNNAFEVISRFDVTNSDLNNEEFLQIREANDTVWFLSRADIGFYDPAGKKLVSYDAFGANSSIIFYNDRTILQSNFGDGIRIFNVAEKSYMNTQLIGMLTQSQTRFVYKDSRNKLWLSISNVGLLLLDSITQQTDHILISNKDNRYADLNSNVIYQINESSDGAIWVCTEEGINMIDVKPDIFNTHFLQSGQNAELTLGVRSTLNSGKGFVWIGSVGEGLFRFDLKTEEISRVSLKQEGRVLGKNIQAILEDHQGNLWLGTEGEGIIRLLAEGKTNKFKDNILNYRVYPTSFPVKTMLNDYVMCMLEDRKHNIWIGTWYGLSLLTSEELSQPDQAQAEIRNFLHDPNDPGSISDNTVMSLLEDREGNIWIGTHAGINRLIESGGTYSFRHDFRNTKGDMLKGKIVLDMYQDKEGDIWFSSQEGGICQLDPVTGIYVEYNSENGFHDYVVNSIAQDSLGIFWLGTNNGLCRFDPSTRAFNMYYAEDGLISNDFFYRSGCSVNEYLFFGGNKGFSWFNPYIIKPEPVMPNLVFTDFRLFNESVPLNSDGSPLSRHISVTEDLVLKYNQNYITFEFAALNYRHQHSIHYECMLEGLENAWTPLDQEHKMTYTNLKPGEYVFKIRAYTTGHRNNSSIISLPLTIRPPFWKTTLAYVIYILLVILIIFFTYRYFLNAVKKKHAIDLERMNAKRIHEMDMMKLQFYTNISHELRTPLTLISAPLETMLNESVSKQKTKSYYQLMHKNVQRLRRLINQLLDMRKLEEGHLRVEWSQGNVIEFIRRVFTNFESYAEKRKIRFTFHSSADQLMTFFDADKLDKVLFNLLSNSFKYTPDKGSVTINVDVRSGSIIADRPLKSGYYVISISDSGIGIPEESLPNIFKPFHQVKKNKPIGSAGSGIGLSLTKDLIELHEGMISVSSEVGKGSLFEVKLPVFRELPEEKAERELPDEHKPAGGEIHSGSQIQETKKPGISPVLLIVEDNEELRTFIRDELRQDYRILEAANGHEGFETAIENIPDLILTDVMMDKMDGMKLCKKLKHDQRTSHIPVILLTARHSEEVKHYGFDIGADDYITKPFNIELLKARIRNLIEQRRKLRMLFSLSDNTDFSEITSNKTDARFLDKMNKIIDANIDNPDFGPMGLASAMAMSKMQLYRKVSALTNQTVYNYIRTIRMNRAAQLLITSDLQIAEVAYSVGFTEASNFTKAFTQHYNVTPSRFVQEHKN